MKTGSERRNSVRHSTSLNVILEHPDGGTLRAKTVDLSEGGIFLQGQSVQRARVGDVVSVKVDGLLSRTSPRVSLKVVRSDRSGVGLQFKS